MSSLVEELQRDALDPKCSVTNLLRKAKVAATKLDLTDLLNWIEEELSGYKGFDVPEYRVTIGTLWAKNPYHGWIPVQFASAETARSMSKCAITQQIAEIEQLATSGSKSFVRKYSSAEMSHIMSRLDMPFEPKLEINSTFPLAILDTVRNIILNWSLELEKNGIMGAGMSFSTADKERAHSPNVTYKIGSISHFTGNMGGVSGHGVVRATTNVGLDTAGLASLLEQLEQSKGQFGLARGKQAELEGVLANLKTELNNPKPKASKLGALLGIARAVIQSAGSSLLVDGALAGIDKFKHLF